MKSAKAKQKTLEIHLKKFKPSKMSTNRVCLMVGRKGCGKSTLVEDILWFQQCIPLGLVMSATEEANEAYKIMVPPLFIYKDFDVDALQRIIDRQKKMKKMWLQANKQLAFDHRAFAILDDCLYDKKQFASKLVRELFMNGRHWDLFVLITVQYVMDMPPATRTNTDYVFAFKEPITANRERLWKQFFGVFNNFPVFDALYLEVTQDYRCLVLDNTKSSCEISDCVFWYKAQKRPPFRLGADYFWKYSESHARKAGDDDAMMEELKEMNSKSVRVVFDGEPVKKPVDVPEPKVKEKGELRFERAGERWHNDRFSDRNRRRYSGDSIYESYDHNPGYRDNYDKYDKGPLRTNNPNNPYNHRRFMNQPPPPKFEQKFSQNPYDDVEPSFGAKPKPVRAAFSASTISPNNASSVVYRREAPITRQQNNIY